MPAYCTRLVLASGGGGVAQIFSGLWPHNGGSGERAARGERSLQLQSPDTSSSHTATQLEHYKHFSPTDLGRGSRRGEKLLETARCRGGGCAIAGSWGGGVQDVPSSAFVPLALCATGFSKATLLTCYRKKAAKDILW